MSADLAEAVRAALRSVIDPELGENIVDLGLVYAIEVSDGCIARIRMTTTTRGCPAAAFLKDAVHDCAWDVPGIEYVEVSMVYDPPWTPEMMLGDARDHLRF